MKVRPHLQIILFFLLKSVNVLYFKVIFQLGHIASDSLSFMPNLLHEIRLLQRNTLLTYRLRDSLCLQVVSKSPFSVRKCKLSSFHCIRFAIIYSRFETSKWSQIDPLLEAKIILHLMFSATLV